MLIISCWICLAGGHWDCIAVAFRGRVSVDSRDFRPWMAKVCEAVWGGGDPDRCRWKVLLKLIYDDLWWIMMNYDDLWWSMMIYDDLWWSMMIYDDLCTSDVFQESWQNPPGWLPIHRAEAVWTTPRANGSPRARRCRPDSSSRRTPRVTLHHRRATACLTRPGDICWKIYMHKNMSIYAR